MPYDMTDEYEQVIELEGEIYRSYTINMPVHACVVSLEIGLIIMESYLKARHAGDENVYFIDGMSFFARTDQHEFTLDSIHPNDAGFLMMAEGISCVLRHILEKAQEE